MRCLFALVAIVPLLVAGCGEIPAESSGGGADASGQTAAANVPPQKPSLGKPIIPDKPPVKKDFADIDEAWAVLSKAVADEESWQIEAAVTWLAARGQPIIGRMTTIMNDSSAGVADRLAACIVLSRIGVPARAELLAALSSDCYNVQVKAAETLGKMTPPTKEVVDALLVLLNDKDERVQRFAIRAVADIGYPANRATPRLLEILNGPGSDNETLRGEASRALKKVDPRRGLMVDE